MVAAGAEGGAKAGHDMTVVVALVAVRAGFVERGDIGQIMDAELLLAPHPQDPEPFLGRNVVRQLDDEGHRQLGVGARYPVGILDQLHTGRDLVPRLAHIREEGAAALDFLKAFRLGDVVAEPAHRAIGAGLRGQIGGGHEHAAPALAINDRGAIGRQRVRRPDRVSARAAAIPITATMLRPVPRDPVFSPDLAMKRSPEGLQLALALGLLALELAADSRVRDRLRFAATQLQLLAPTLLGIVLALAEKRPDIGETRVVGSRDVRKRLRPRRPPRPVGERPPFAFWPARTFLSLISHWGMVAPQIRANPVG